MNSATEALSGGGGLGPALQCGLPARNEGFRQPLSQDGGQAGGQVPSTEVAHLGLVRRKDWRTIPGTCTVLSECCLVPAKDAHRGLLSWTPSQTSSDYSVFTTPCEAASRYNFPSEIKDQRHGEAMGPAQGHTAPVEELGSNSRPCAPETPLQGRR